MKVRVNSLYVFNANGYDLFDAKGDIPEGTVVKVINCRGCPPANTMGHCHVGDKDTGKLICLVDTRSLTKPERAGK